MKDDQSTPNEVPEDTAPVMDSIEQPTTIPVDETEKSVGTPSPVSADEPTIFEPSAIGQPMSETPTSEAPITEAPAVNAASAPQQSEEPVSEPVVFAATPTPTAPKKKKKGLLIGGIIAAVLIVLGGGSALAYTLWYQNPEKVVGDAIVHALSAKTLSATGMATIEQTDQFKIAVTFDSKSSEAASEISATLEVKAEDFEYKVEGAGYFAIEGDLYVKFNNVRDVMDTFAEQAGDAADLTAFDSLIAKIDGRWIKISSSDIGEFSEEYKQSQQCITDAAKSLADNQDISKEVTDLYKANKFIIVGESLGSKDIKGTGSLGYKITGDTAKADAFFTGLKDTQLGKKLLECDDTLVFDDIIQDAAEEANEPTTEVQLWVSRFGHQVTEINATISDDESKGSFILNPLFNQELNLATPADAITFEELRTEVENAYNQYYEDFYANYDYDVESSEFEYEYEYDYEYEQS